MSINKETSETIEHKVKAFNTDRDENFQGGSIESFLTEYEYSSAELNAAIARLTCQVTRLTNDNAHLERERVCLEEELYAIKQQMEQISKEKQCIQDQLCSILTQKGYLESENSYLKEIIGNVQKVVSPEYLENSSHVRNFKVVKDFTK